MKLLIELPTWLGDAVMATPALEKLYDTYSDAEITLVGSYVATEALKAHPRVTRVVVDRTKSGGFRPLNVYRLAKELGPHDLALSFRSHFYSRLLLIFTHSDKQYLFNPNSTHYPLCTTHSSLRAVHQVEKYQAFVNTITGRNDTPGPLRLDHPALPLESLKHKTKSQEPETTKTQNQKPKTLGINPGASYGSAKRWYPEKFSEVAATLAGDYEILIFGGPGETDIAADIEELLCRQGIHHVTNLAGKTTIPQLCGLIASLDLFVTGDSGPMHIAAAYRVPTVAIFGPTRHEETCQWMNPHSAIVRHDLDCAPCMKRSCPLKHHDCMKGIEAQEVLSAIRRIERYRSSPDSES
ncbi:lipopolysaccharide heptosyltransferase II [Nitratifractor sp.]